MVFEMKKKKKILLVVILGGDRFLVCGVTSEGLAKVTDCNNGKRSRADANNVLEKVHLFVVNLFNLYACSFAAMCKIMIDTFGKANNFKLIRTKIIASNCVGRGKKKNCRARF